MSCSISTHLERGNIYSSGIVIIENFCPYCDQNSHLKLHIDPNPLNTFYQIYCPQHGDIKLFYFGDKLIKWMNKRTKEKQEKKENE
jgi:hypothetical protein